MATTDLCSMDIHSASSTCRTGEPECKFNFSPSLRLRTHARSAQTAALAKQRRAPSAECPQWACVRRCDRQSQRRIPALSIRSKRRLKLTSARLQRRAIFLLGGIAVGAAAVALALLADQAQLAFAVLPRQRICGKG
jgi:hypothetical protein